MLADYYSEKTVYSKISAGRKNAILALLGDRHTVLDVGCGEGILGEMIKNKTGATVHGIDISPASIAKAKRRMDIAQVWDIESNGIDHIPELFHKYDAVVISEVLEHLFRPEDLLVQVKKLCGQDTRVIITVPNILFWKNRLRIFLGHFDYTESGLMDRGHIHFFSWKSFQAMVNQVGFQIEETAHHVPTRGTRILSKIFPGLFAQNFIVALRRL